MGTEASPRVLCTAEGSASERLNPERPLRMACVLPQPGDPITMRVTFSLIGGGGAYEKLDLQSTNGAIYGLHTEGNWVLIVIR
jgi:hypothetical protein